MTTIFSHFHESSAGLVGQLQEQLKELTQLLALPPTGIRINFKPLPLERADALHHILSGDKPKHYFYLNEVYPLFKDSKLLLCCPEVTPIVRELKNFSIEGSAQWGAFAPQGEGLSVVWKLNDKYILWHEVLHSLGADDCYDPKTKQQRCEMEGCIMQWVPTSASVRDWPFICQGNIARIKFQLDGR